MIEEEESEESYLRKFPTQKKYSRTEHKISEKDKGAKSKEKPAEERDGETCPR